MKYVSPNQNKAGAVSISSSVLSEFFQHEYNMALRQYTALEQGPVLNVTNESISYRTGIFSPIHFAAHSVITQWM